MKFATLFTVAYTAATASALAIRGNIQPFQFKRIGGPDFGHTPETAPVTPKMDSAAATSNIAFWLSPVQGQNTTVFTGITQKAAKQGDIFNYDNGTTQLFLEPDTIEGRWQFKVGYRYTQANASSLEFDGFTITASGDAQYLGYNGEWENKWSACNDKTVGDNYFLYFGTAGGFSDDCKTAFSVEVDYLPGFN